MVKFSLPHLGKDPSRLLLIFRIMFSSLKHVHVGRHIRGVKVYCAYSFVNTLSPLTVFALYSVKIERTGSSYVLHICVL